MPTGGGLITSWETSFGSPGAPVSLVMLRPTSTAGSYTVVGSDSESLPTPIAANHISAFAVSTPIAVQGGDVLGIAVGAHSASACIYEGGTGDTIFDGIAPALAPGTSLTGPSSGEKERVNLSAELIQSVDLSLGEAITPASGAPGVALISLTPGGPGPGGVPATVSDIVPAGLTVLAAATSSGGSCSVTGQTVTCSLSEVSLGAAAPVIDIVVSSTAPGTYTNQALLTPGLADSNPANNTASATLTVTAPNPPAMCTVISFKGATLGLTETALKALHCHVGKVKKVASKTVRKGLVVSTSLKPGTSAAANTTVGINVSSGKPKKKHH